MRPRLLDLFCGAGGAAVGYHRAGFDVVGVDITPQPNYPFEFVQADALDCARLVIRCGTATFDAIHASPPCQAYIAACRRATSAADHPDLIGPTRELLQATGLPYVIENVARRPAASTAVLLCGSMFGLGVRRHRLFETNWPLMTPLPARLRTAEIRAYYGSNRWHRLDARRTRSDGEGPQAATRHRRAGRRRHGHRLDDLGRAPRSDPARLHRADRPPAPRPRESGGGVTGSEARIRLERRDRIERLFKACPAELYTAGGGVRMFELLRQARAGEEAAAAKWVKRYQAKRGQRTRGRHRRRDRRLAVGV